MEQLEIYKTNYGMRMLLLVLISVFAVLDFFCFLHRKIAEQRVTGKQQVVFWSMIMTVFLCYFPFLNDYIFMGENTILYLNRIADGNHILLTQFGFPIMMIYKIITFVLLVVTALVSYWLFKQITGEEYSALFGSVFYQVSVRRLEVFYEKAAWNQVLMMLFLLFLCCGSYRLWAKKSGLAEALFGGAGIILCLCYAPITLPDMVWMLMHLAVSLLAMLVFAKAYGKNRISASVVAGVVLFVNTFAVIYYVNHLVFTATPVYLYNIENLGSIRYESMLQMSAGKELLFSVGKWIMLVAFVLLMLMGLKNKRKAGENEE